MVGGFAHALSMQTGEVLWRSALPEHDTEADAFSLMVADGVIVFAMRDKVEPPHGILAVEGANKVIGITSADGSHLWDYDVDGIMWNFMPSTPGDGTVLFATNSGHAYRLDLQTGKPLWKAGPAEVPWSMIYSCG